MLIMVFINVGLDSNLPQGVDGYLEILCDENCFHMLLDLASWNGGFGESCG